MIYWKIELSDGRLGFQVMTDERETVNVLDESGNSFSGNIEYRVIGEEPAPVWAA
jgi:hypothetical protein